MIEADEILQTMHMFQEEKLDVYTFTVGINLLDCACEDAVRCGRRAYDKICHTAQNQVQIPAGIVELSLAPTPSRGDSVAHILTEMGLEFAGAPGTTAALAMLNDAVKKRRRHGFQSRRRPERRVHSRFRRHRHD